MGAEMKWVLRCDPSGYFVALDTERGEKVATNDLGRARTYDDIHAAYQAAQSALAAAHDREASDG